MSRKPQSNNVPVPPPPPVAVDTTTPPPKRPRWEFAEFWRALFGIDLRSLALFRISLGLFLLADLFMRSVDLEAFYTDFGVLPRGVPLNTNWGHSYYFCFHTITGSVAGEAALFLINAVFVFLFLIGWNTRLMSIISWLFLISVQSRNPLVLQGGDVLLRCLLFWGIFLPLGSYLAVDARRVSLPRLPGADPERPVRAFSLGTIAILLQVSMVYWFTALLKDDPTWWQTGYAIYLALNIDLLTKPLGRWLVQMPYVAYALTFITIWIEGFGAFGAFVPFWNGPVRTATVFLFWFFHLIALQSMMYLGPFPYICALGWMLFLPAWFWDKLALWWQRGRKDGLRQRLSATVRPLLPTVATVEPNSPRPNRSFYLGLPLVGQIIVGFYLFVVIAWNIRSVNYGQGVHWFPARWNNVANLPHLDQAWDMFSPRPMSDDGWYILSARLRDGSVVDMMPYLAEYGDPPPMTTKKPAEVGQQFHDERWRKYFLNMWPRVNQRYRGYLADYVVRRWKRDHPSGPKEMCTLDLIYMEEDTPMQYGIPLPAHPVPLWTQWCSPEFAPKKQSGIVITPVASPSPASVHP